MPPYFQKSFTIPSFATDRFDRLKCSYLLGLAQEVAGEHSALLKADFAHTQLYWVITRQQVQITRLPASGETITLETWPMPTTRVAYPRSTIAYDQQGNELFRSISLWVLMDPESRAMVLPGKSGVLVEGALRGNELSVPRAILPALLQKQEEIFTPEIFRQVERTVLLRNVDMNWIEHIDAMDDLKESVGLNAYAQRDPVVEYRIQGMNMFEEMSSVIRANTVRMLLTVRPREDSTQRKQILNGTVASDSKAVKPTPAKKAEKVGPNDPCPCGSGLKYKKCCAGKENK